MNCKPKKTMTTRHNHLLHVTYIDNLQCLSKYPCRIQSYIMALVITHRRLENKVRASKATSWSLAV